MTPSTLKDLPREGWTVSKIGTHIVTRNGNVIAPDFHKPKDTTQKPCDCGDAGGWPA